MDEPSGGGWSEAPGGGTSVPKLPGDRYRIDGLLGRGGMGEVFLAWDAHLSRQVALKRIHGGAVDPNRVARLLREARVAAQLDHPSIVPVLDLGETAEGALFYTMRLVRGRTLLAARPELSSRQVLRHFRDAVEAIAFAHAHGVVHRDLKPENVMVGAFGETQVVDWGLARSTGSADLPAPAVSGAEDEDLTRVGDVIGTERYLSAEAARGEPMGPSDDVYALGATLVELSTGERARDPQGWRELATRLDDPELRALAAKALADRDGRYPDAPALSADLNAYLDGRPIGAYAYSAWELARRTAERFKWPLRVGSAAVLAASAALGVAWVGVVQERDRAVAAEQREKDARLGADRVLARSLAQQAVAALHQGARVDAALLASHALALAELPRARGVLMGVGRLGEVGVEHPESGCPEDPLVSADGWLCAAGDRVWLPGGQVLHEGLREDVARSPTGAWVALELETLHAPSPAQPHPGTGLLFADGDRAARLLRLGIVLDSVEGAHVQVDPCDGKQSHRMGAWSPAGFWTVCLDAVAARVGLDGSVRRVALPGLEVEVHAMTWTAGTLVLATGADELELRDEQDGRLVERLDPGIGRIRRVEASPMGRWLVLEDDEKGSVLFDLERRATVLRLPERWRGARFLRDGRLATGHGGLSVLDPASVDAPTLRARAGLSMATLDPSGRYLAGALGDGSFVIWNESSGDVLVDRTPWPGFVTKWAAFSPDGGELVVANMAARPARFEVGSWEQLPPFPLDQVCRRVFGLAGGVWYGLSYGHRLPSRLDSGEMGAGVPAATQDGGANGPDHAAAVDHDGGVMRIDRDRGITRLTQIPGAGRIDMTADGELLAVGDAHSVWLLDGAGEEIGRIDVPEGQQDLAVSPDGTWLAVSFLDGTIRVWDLADRTLRAVLEGVHDQRVVSLQLTSEVLVSAGWDGRVHRWRLAPLVSEPDPAALEQRWGLTLADLVAE